MRFDAVALVFQTKRLLVDKINKGLIDLPPTGNVERLAYLNGYEKGAMDAANLVVELQSIDPEELRPKGRWIPLEYDGFADGNPVWDLWECSECQEEHSGDEDTLTPYCPNCGADMRVRQLCNRFRK